MQDIIRLIDVEGHPMLVCYQQSNAQGYDSASDQGISGSCYYYPDESMPAREDAHQWLGVHLQKAMQERITISEPYDETAIVVIRIGSCRHHRHTAPSATKS